MLSVLLAARTGTIKVGPGQDALAPAWSLDGRRVAYWPRTGRDAFVVAWLSLEQ